ncbi:right-handed_parallel beta-helix repeat-containing protein [Hexamita inflata]|uniref:Right-handed parallel beta-helix repeat-containing protein n=1 Tax=Hexamita inflata TaxID=28002 RepID=A0AA86PNC8_9EUKA|nr:right-handed parallel beta-helix repeat-containing protein [Hexamita inflata]
MILLYRICTDANVEPGNNSAYQTIQSAVYSGNLIINVFPGIYNEQIVIDVNNLKIIGTNQQNVVIISPKGQNGIIIRANNVFISNITIDSQTNNADVAIVIQDGMQPGNPNFNIGCNNTIVNCLIKGSSNRFAIYVAGASYSAGSQTIQYYNNQQLQQNNTIIQNTLISNCDCDGFSFSLQKNGTFAHNIIIGSRLAVYMCIDSLIFNNTIQNSINNGIFLSTPSENCKLINNTILNCKQQGIIVQNELEHNLINGINGKKFVIQNNSIQNSQESCISICGDVNNPIYGFLLQNNSFQQCGDHGIYLQYSYGRWNCFFLFTM